MAFFHYFTLYLANIRLLMAFINYKDVNTHAATAGSNPDVSYELLKKKVVLPLNFPFTFSGVCFGSDREGPLGSGLSGRDRHLNRTHVLNVGPWEVSSLLGPLVVAQ